MDLETKTSELGRLLFEHWDPIGVNSNANLIDEYDDLVPALIELLRRRPTRDELIAWLYAAERDIHCPTSDEIRERMARLLLAVYLD